MIISECFHSSRVVPDYIYTDKYLNFLLEKIIYDHRFASDSDLILYVSEYYDNSCIKNSSMKKRFSEIFGLKDKGKYYLNEQIENDISNYNLIKKNYDDVSNLENYLLFSSLTFNISEYDKFNKMLIVYTALKSNISNFDNNKAIVFVFNYLKDFSFNYERLKLSISGIKKSYLSLTIFQLFEFDDIDKRLLIKNNINTLEELCNLDIYVLMYLFSNNIDKFITTLTTFNINIKNVIVDSFTKIETKNLEIIMKRNGYIDGHKYTLEEIGIENNVTRERIRQLEAKNIKLIRGIAENNYNVLFSFYNYELGKRKPYITLTKILSRYDEEFTSKILLLFEYGDFNITYDSKYQILYDKTSNNIDDMINDFINKTGIVADPIELDKCDLFELNIIKNNYRQISENLYLKKGSIYRDLFLDLIEEIYPKGYHSGNQEEYDNFVSNVNEKYKIYENIPSKHSLEAMIGRSNFVLADRGVYISKKYSAELDSELIDKILNYVSENEFTYYNAIFEEFKKELKRIGINNRYYLKGCLDKHLPEDMTTARDYIVCGYSNKTPYDFVLNQLHSFEGKFTKSDLTKIFVGMKDYTIYNLLYTEIDNGLIWISNSEFIYKDKYTIDEETKYELNQFIEKLFCDLSTKVLTSKKVYAKLQLTNRLLFEKLKLTNGHFELFSIIKALFNNYYYSRPYIFLEESAYNTRSTIIQDYVRKYDSFNHKLILDYQSKLNIGGLYSYLEFMESMSDEYVQVDMDEMVKIEKINLNENAINEIKKVIDLILDNFDSIDTKKFNGYSLLPKISYVWNKYLLVGIIRSYLSEYYEIKNTESTYTGTDFEVRRVKYE